MKELINKYFSIFSFLLIIVIAYLGYANTFEVPLQFDDGAHIRDNDKIRKFENYTTYRHWKNFNNRPLAHYTLALSYHMSDFEVDERGRETIDTRNFHIFNLLVHMLAGIFVFLLVREILSVPMFRKKYPARVANLIALFTALVFVAHPIQTQAVTYIVQRMTSMAGMFYILSVFLYLRGRNLQVTARNINKDVKQQAGFIRRIHRNTVNISPASLLLIAAGLMAGVLGILSKQNAATFLFAWLLVEIMFIRDREGRLFKKFIAVFAAILAVISLGYIGTNGLPREVPDIERSTYFVTQFKVFLDYLQLMIAPVNQNVDHHVQFNDNFFNASIFLGFLVTLAILVTGILSFKKYRLVSFGIFWYFTTAAVESSVIPIRDPMFEHRLYLPFVGFSLIVNDLVYRFIGRKKLAYATYFMAALTFIYLGLTISRNQIWRTEKSLWADSVKKAPEKERNYYWLAAANIAERNFDEALRNFNQAISNNPKFVMAYNARANLRKDMGDEKGAMNDYNKALELDPRYSKALYNRGILKAANKNYKGAVRDYDKAIEYGYRYSSVYYNRGNSKMRDGNYKPAIEDYNIAVKKNPRYALAFYNRGLTYAKMGKHERAIDDINKAVKINPNNYLFYNGKAVSQINLGQYDEAIRNLNESIRLKPDNGQAYYNRGYAQYFGKRNKNEACKDWRLARKHNYGGGQAMLNKYCK